MSVVMRTVDAISVTKLFGQAIDTDMPMIARAIGDRVKRNLGVNLAFAWFRKNQADFRRSVADE